MDEVRQLRDPLRTPASEYELFVQRMLDLAVQRPARSRQIVAALRSAEERGSGWSSRGCLATTEARVPGFVWRAKSLASGATPRSTRAVPRPSAPEASARRGLKAWAELHAIQQGVPVKVSDPLTLRIVADILGRQDEKARQA